MLQSTIFELKHMYAWNINQEKEMLMADVNKLFFGLLLRYVLLLSFVCPQQIYLYIGYKSIK